MKKEIRPYTYDVLKDDILLLRHDFPEAEVGSIPSTRTNARSREKSLFIVHYPLLIIPPYLRGKC